MGRIVELNEDKAIIQVFEGTDNMSLVNTHTKLTGHPMEVSVSPDISIYNEFYNFIKKRILYAFQRNQRTVNIT